MTCTISFHFVSCFFTLLMASSEAQTFITLMRSNTSVFPLVTCDSVVVSKNPLLVPMSERLALGSLLMI